MCSKGTSPRAQTMLTTLGSTINMICLGGGKGAEGGGAHARPLKEHKNLDFANEGDIHMSSENYETNGYRHNLTLLNFVSHLLHVSYPT